MRRISLTVAVLAVLAGLAPARAATTAGIDIVAFQYKWGGRITTDPTSAWLGSPDLAGTPMAAPSVRQGDTVRFTNYDPVVHTIETTVKTTDGKELVFLPLVVASLGGQKSFVVPEKAPLGRLGFFSREYRGMIGYVTVVP